MYKALFRKTYAGQSCYRVDIVHDWDARRGDKTWRATVHMDGGVSVFPLHEFKIDAGYYPEEDAPFIDEALLIVRRMFSGGGTDVRALAKDVATYLRKALEGV
jgi:hypothetical protein